MSIYLIIMIFFSLSNSMLYIQSETLTKLDSENGFFFIKNSDYYNKYNNDFWIHFKATNIMLDSLQYCYHKTVPRNVSELDCRLEIINPYESKTNSNIMDDYYKMDYYRSSYNFIVFYYSGVKIKSNFEIEVKCSKIDERNTSNKNNEDAIIIILISVSCVLFVALVIITICLVIARKKLKKTDVGQINNNLEINNSSNDNNNNPYSAIQDYPNNQS